MRMKTGLLALTAALSLVMAFGVWGHTAMAKEAVKKITKEELKTRLDDPNVVVVDVRLGKDWQASEEKIKGAVRVEAGKIESLTTQYPKEKTLVLYCA